MSQPYPNTQYIWNEQYKQYLERRYINSQWVQEWKPSGWRPPQQQPISPRTPKPSPDYSDSAFGSSPVGSPGPAVWPYTATPAAAGSFPRGAGHYSSPNQPTGHLFYQPTAPPDFAYQERAWHGTHVGPPIKRLPKGVGPKIKGQYNAELGTTPENLHYEEVDRSYYVRDRNFFQEGKVFAVIFSETAGATATSYNSSISEARYIGHYVHTQSRRFVVVRRKTEFCYACPIFTYSQRATLKRGVRPEEHGIVYSEDQEPRLITGEKGIKKPSIAVAMAQGEPDLHIASRIYYGIHHPIQYNVKVKDIGQVWPDHLPSLIGNWKAEDQGETKQAPEVTANAEEPELPHVPEEDHEGEGESVVGRWPSHHIPESPTSHKDPHLYHSKNNVYGYDAKIAPHMYHPVHNQYGYHPKNNPHGYHPESNACSYHPQKNPYGYHPQKAPFSYHPQFSTFGYHGELNVHGYHPDVTPFNYHPQSNHLGYHPEHNVYGYHPQSNPHGYHPQLHPYGFHPTHNPDAYHPTWKPQGRFYVTDNREDSTSEDEGEGEDSGAEEEDEPTIH